MILKRVPITDEEYKVDLDDHCLVVAVGDMERDKKIWLSKSFCKWIKDNFESIDFEKQDFGGIEFSGAENDA